MDEHKQYLPYLPRRLRGEVEKMAQGKCVEEIRLRRGMPLSLTVGGENLRGRGCMTGEEAQEMLIALCGGSLHAHAQTLREGYVVLPSGGRAAVVGLASVSGGAVDAVREITAISIRIPHTFHGNVGPLLAQMNCSHFSEGLLLYSLPGMGKTTLLRELAVRLSSAPYLKRVALVDTRMELYRAEDFAGCLCDVLRGYPQPIGITAAVRNLSPQILICDEIGTDADADAILAAYPTGVPLIASVHGGSAKEVAERRGIAELLAHGVFRTLFCLQRTGSTVRLTREVIPS